jgi:hypothetical protein
MCACAIYDVEASFMSGVPQNHQFAPVNEHVLYVNLVRAFLSIKQEKAKGGTSNIQNMRTLHYLSPVPPNASLSIACLHRVH